MKNKGTWIIVGIVAAFVLLIAGIFVTTNNRAISLEEQVLTADSDVQTQEKRRTDLIYNLADCVRNTISMRQIHFWQLLTQGIMAVWILRMSQLPLLRLRSSTRN